MRKTPLYIAGIFLLVQVSGLAGYAISAGGMGDFRGWLFALALECGVFVAAYWTRQSVTRKDEKIDRRDQGARISALAVLIVFLIASGFLNTAKAIRDLPVDADALARISAYVFGIIPSLFATVLGIMQGFVDRLPAPPVHHAKDNLQMQVYALAENLVMLANARVSDANAPAKSANAKNALASCKVCKAKVHNIGAHMRWVHPKEKK